jgi:zinc ribbon protein
MFCPKCGAESLDGQRFCKSCGTNLQLINNALRGGEGGQSIYGVDIEALKQNAIEFAKSWKEGWSGTASPGLRVGVVRGHTTREIKRRERDESRKRNLPRPKDWLKYTWQHNLRNGLMSLFSGLGLGAVLYYIGQNLAGWGAFDGIPNITEKQLEAIKHAAEVIWMISVFPVVKGVAQIIYAAFFAESMKTLSERFTVPVRQEQETLTPALPQEPADASYPRLDTPPASVTEHTTEIFEPVTSEARRETQ